METILGDIRVGTVIEAKTFPEAKKPAYQLTVDFGEIGILKSSAQITAYYTPETLVGRQVIGLVGIPPKRIAGFTSQCLILGAYDGTGQVVLLQPDKPVDNGSRIG